MFCSVPLQNFFTKISAAKIEAGIFVGPQIRKILDRNEFFEKLTTERAAWNSFAPVVRGFLGNHKAIFIKFLIKLMKTCSKRDCRVSFKVHMLDANLDQFFIENMGAHSEELGERFLRNSLY